MTETTQKPLPLILRLRTMLFVGVFLHLAAAISVYLIGRFRIFPNWILAGGTLQEDATRNLAYIQHISDNLLSGSFGPLLSAEFSIEVRIYAISYALFSLPFGENILAIEAVNLGFFVATLFLVYILGTKLLDESAGKIAGYVSMLIPSILLHFTQPLRDPVFIVLFLSFILGLVLLGRKDLNLRGAAVWLALFAPGYALLWFVRDRWGLLFLTITVISLFFLIYTAVRNKKSYRINIAVLFLFVCFTVVLPKVFAGYESEKRPLTSKALREIKLKSAERRANGQPEFLIGINRIRDGFIRNYEEAGSNVDDDAEIESTTDFVLYLPRALMIGLLSPFPNAWFSDGTQFGKGGRLLAGFESCFMYLVIALAISSTFFRRRPLRIMLLIIVGSSLTVLGLVITNSGALYRMRYAFWFLLIILGVTGFLELRSLLTKENSGKLVQKQDRSE